LRRNNFIMCGIAGFIFPWSQTGTSSSRHPGFTAPWARCRRLLLWWTGEAGDFGHRRLSIIDLSEAANQPFYSHDGRYVMIYNGEVYNYKEICRQISHPNPVQSSDSEIILESVCPKKGCWEHQWFQRDVCAGYLGIKKKRSFFLIRDRFWSEANRLLSEKWWLYFCIRTESDIKNSR